MPRLIYSPEEAHELLTVADAAAAEGRPPELVALYRELATTGLDLDACIPDETVRARVGLPPLPGAGDDEHDAAGHDGGDHPRVA